MAEQQFTKAEMAAVRKLLAKHEKTLEELGGSARLVIDKIELLDSGDEKEK